MSAIDETWSVEPCGCCIRTESGMLYRVPVAANIIACAPEMARMLLANEWRFTCDRFERADGSYSYYECMTCGAAQDAGHADDCAWLALMRKAGLR